LYTASVRQYSSLTSPDHSLRAGSFRAETASLLRLCSPCDGGHQERLMKVLVFASQKGGAGKTTLTGHLAVEAERQGKGPCLLMDADPQGSLVEWWNSREAPTPVFAQADVSNLGRQLVDLGKKGFQYAFIDTPPAITGTIQSVIQCADMVVIPTRPSPHDLRAVGRTVVMCQAAGKRPVFVINGAANRARITAEAAISLSEFGAVCPVVVYQRTDFASSMTDGRTAQELDEGSRSALEMRSLWKYLHSQMKKVD
jgi:chromosome partitioning protein